jgi:hypothetical protein
VHVYVYFSGNLSVPPSAAYLCLCWTSSSSTNAFRPSIPLSFLSFAPWQTERQHAGRQGQCGGCIRQRQGDDGPDAGRHAGVEVGGVEEGVEVIDF